jgi:hypothetical protein
VVKIARPSEPPPYCELYQKKHIFAAFQRSEESWGPERNSRCMLFRGDGGNLSVPNRWKSGVHYTGGRQRSFLIWVESSDAQDVRMRAAARSRAFVLHDKAETRWATTEWVSASLMGNVKTNMKYEAREMWGKPIQGERLSSTFFSRVHRPCQVHSPRTLLHFDEFDRPDLLPRRTSMAEVRLRRAPSPVRISAFQQPWVI